MIEIPSTQQHRLAIKRAHEARGAQVRNFAHKFVQLILFPLGLLRMPQALTEFSR